MDKGYLQFQRCTCCLLNWLLVLIDLLLFSRLRSRMGHSAFQIETVLWIAWKFASMFKYVLRMLTSYCFSLPWYLHVISMLIQISLGCFCCPSREDWTELKVISSHCNSDCWSFTKYLYFHIFRNFCSVLSWRRMGAATVRFHGLVNSKRESKHVAGEIIARTSSCWIC
jgi:hypothetical protein